MSAPAAAARAPAPAAPAPAPLSADVGTCEDCGQGFTAGVVAHYTAAHAGMPRYRWAEGPGKSFVACASGDFKVDARKARVPNGNKDPIDAVGAHLQTHEDD